MHLPVVSCSEVPLLLLHFQLRHGVCRHRHRHRIALVPGRVLFDVVGHGGDVARRRDRPDMSGGGSYHPSGSRPVTLHNSLFTINIYQYVKIILYTSCRHILLSYVFFYVYYYVIFNRYYYNIMCITFDVQVCWRHNCARDIVREEQTTPVILYCWSRSNAI